MSERRPVRTPGETREDVLVACITIECTLDKDDQEHIDVYVQDANGDTELPLREGLGLLEYAKLYLSGALAAPEEPEDD